MSTKKHKFKQNFIALYWQPIKALLCVVQFIFLDAVCRSGIARELDSLNVTFNIWYALIRPLNCVLIIFALWKCYDNIDDKSFEAFWHEKEPPALLRRPAWKLAIVVGAVGVAPMLGLGLWEPLSYTGLPSAVGIPLCVVAALAAMASFRVWQVKDLYDTWLIQRKLHSPDVRFSIVRRIVDAVVFFFVVYFLCYWGGLHLIIVLLRSAFVMIVSFYKQFPSFTVGLAIVLVGLLVFTYLMLIKNRLKFIGRLKKLRKRGEISFKTAGHPYLSVFSPRIHFGILIQDKHCIDKQGRQVRDRYYLVTMVGAQRKRQIVVLAPEQVIRFRHEIRLRFSPTGTVMSGMGQKQTGRTSLALTEWHTNYAFVFPQADGFADNKYFPADVSLDGGVDAWEALNAATAENARIPTEVTRVLMVDPVPAHLSITKGTELIDLDNGSEVFGYVVWSKNAFVNLLERT